MPLIQVTRILCPVDFSDTSGRAIEHAAAWARWFGSDLTLLHVYSVPLLPAALYTEYPVTADLAPRVRDYAIEELDRFGAAVEAGGLPLERVVAQGEAVSQILGHAEDLPADLLVLGTHGRSGVERWLLGSVTERIVRRSPCPVLTVPPGLADPHAPAPVEYRSILCPLDFSAPSRRALDYGFALAQESRAELTLAHVIEWGPEDPGPAATAGWLAEHRSRLMREAQDQLRGMVPDDVRLWCQPHEIVAAGRPYREILRIAGEIHADLIVIGCHGRGAIDLALFGSTTHQVIRGATCPVLSLRS